MPPRQRAAADFVECLFYLPTLREVKRQRRRRPPDYIAAEARALMTACTPAARKDAFDATIALMEASRFRAYIISDISGRRRPKI